ncbi:MAG TPA: STAS domain-containing protein [Solirubrobacteraceae bacterium]|nr:STAS domain-containing protein [Solirubrobacteraceae bacterium]
MSPPVWRHKLILTGRLDHRTATELEDEIECLCEEGVAILTLDLRQLDAIDSIGARTIAVGGAAACERRGCDLTVVAGPPAVRDALCEVGAESLLMGDRGQTGAVRPAARASESSLRETSTVMVKDL